MIWEEYKVGYYRSEKECAYFALRELEKYLPSTPDNEGTEWGTIIYRYDDPEGGYWYSFLNPTKGKTREWEPTLLAPSGSTERAYCHTHPNNKGFSKSKDNTACCCDHI